MTAKYILVQTLVKTQLRRLPKSNCRKGPKTNKKNLNQKIKKENKRYIKNTLNCLPPAAILVNTSLAKQQSHLKGKMLNVDNG